MIGNSIGWTVGLLSLSIVIAWVLGLILGTLAGFFPNEWWARAMENMLITVYPIPYYILAFVMLMAFTYYLPLFPLVGGSRGVPGFSWSYLSSLVYYGFLPALSLIIGGGRVSFHHRQGAHLDGALERLRALCRDGGPAQA